MHRTPIDVLEAACKGGGLLKFILSPTTGRVLRILNGAHLLPDPDEWAQLGPWWSEVTGSLLREIGRLVLFAKFAPICRADGNEPPEKTLSADGRVVTVEAHGDEMMFTLEFEAHYDSWKVVDDGEARR